jgi:hypothetical protein
MTGIAVASIVVGTLSAAVGILGISAGLGFMAMAKMPLPTSTAVPSTVYHVDNGACVLTVAESIGSCAAGGLLVLAGTHMLRNSPKSWRMHRMYIVIKVPLAFLNGFANWWVFTSIIRYSWQVGSSPETATYIGAFFQSVGMALLSLAYPIILLCLLPTRTSRNFLAELRQYSNAKL